VQGVLAARIDRLTPEEKHLLQHLAVIGREFPLGLVHKVFAEPEDELYRLLSSLQAKEFLYEQPAFPEVEYIFKHALTQEVAYGTVLQEQRKALHEETASAIETLYSATLEDHYGELAHHYTRSGNAAKAIEFLHLAGQQAIRRSANEEAIGHLTQGLALLTGIEDGSARAQHELTLQMALSAPIMNAKGYGAPELERVCNRARELCQELGETPQLFGALAGLWIFHANGRAPLKTARELVEQLLLQAEQQDDSGLLVCAHVAMAYNLLVQAELPAARVHFDQGIELYDAQRHRSLISLWGLDLGVAGHTLAAWNLWVLGYPDEAGKRSTDALALAHEQAHSFGLAWALALAAMFHTLRGEVQTAEAQAEAGVTRAREFGFTLPLAWGTVVHGWTRAEQGQCDGSGIGQAREGLDILGKAGAEALVPLFLALLAEMHGKAGQPEKGLAVLNEALELCDRRGDHWCEAELYRLRGELTLQSGAERPESAVQQEAEACFQKSLETSREQSAKSWELRAAMSLARLWQSQGKHAEAHELLSGVYDWFTEGFDTKDLQEAKALLTQLQVAA
jgi:predicted ATPase